MQRQSIVLWQTHFQGHIITVLDMLWAILVTTEQTGIGSAAVKSLWEEGDRNVLSCLIASYFKSKYENIALLSDIFSRGNFKLAASTVW